jgi:aerobic C4-dicarboxylate transport protein
VRVRHLLTSLYGRVILGIAIGVVVGVFAPELAVQLQPLADVFIHLVTMTIAPLVFCTVVTGIAHMTSLRAVGKVGGLAIIYFEVASTLALFIGLTIVDLVGPGRGMAATITAAGAAKVEHAKSVGGSSNFVLDLIPELGGHHVVSVLLVAILFGIALHGIRERGTPVLELVERVGEVVFRVVAMVMQLAPVGALGAMAFTIGSYGAGSLTHLAWLMGCFYATCLVFIFGVLGVVAHVHGFSAWRFVKYIRRELLVVLATSSSESVLPRMMQRLEDLGAKRSVVGLVIPAGYSFNLDGTAIYLTLGAMFVAQATGTPMTLPQQLALLAVAMLTSKGAAGVTGSGFVVLAATLEAFHDVPVAGLALILGIDRFMSEARSLTNVIGNGIATLVVARWCRELDRDKLTAELTGQKQQESR